MIVRFANYGFPRAHAAAYGVLAFQTAYLKTHYPVEFMASMLTAVMGNHRKVAEYVVECRRMNIPVLPPDVNESGILFTPGGGETGIRFGLAAIKNVGTQAVDSIITERAKGPFESLLDFCRRVDLRVCNKRVIESLIQAGAFDTLPGHRAQLFAMLDEVVEAATKWRKEREDLQIQLFDFVETPNWEIEYPDIPKYTITQQLELERELLGLYLSGHPLDDFTEVLEELEADKLMELHDAPEHAQIVTAGMVVSVKSITTKQGKAMAFMELEDQIERTEVVLFPEVWRRSQNLAAKGQLIALRAKVQLQDEGFKLLADEVDELRADKLQRMMLQRNRGSGGKERGSSGEASTPKSGKVSRSPSLPNSGRVQNKSERQGAVTDRKPARFEQRVFIKIKPDIEKSGMLTKLKVLLQEHPGNVATILFYEETREYRALSDSYRIKPSPELIHLMEQMLGEDTVIVK